MGVTTVDVENTITLLDPADKSSGYGQPYHPNNKLVCVGVKQLGQPARCFVFDHVEQQGTTTDHQELQAVLDQTTLFVAHNAKHDLAWLRECGLKYNGPVWDTMIFDYVHSKGRKVPLHLGACLERHGIQDAKGDLFSRYSPTETDKIPLQELIEYNLNDVDIEEKLYLSQLAKSTSSEPSIFMQNSVNLSNRFCPVLTNMERAGVAINEVRLEELRVEYQEELTRLNHELAIDVQRLMGATTYNLGSNDDLNAILYSRLPRDKAKWKEHFNIGTSTRGAVKKANRITLHPQRTFSTIVAENMSTVYKVQPERCTVCGGKGSVHKVKKDGTPYSKSFKCTHCQGTGVFNRPLPGQVAGLKLIPANRFVSAAGFSCDSDTLEFYLEHSRTSADAKVFLAKLLRRNKLDTWVNTFLLSIKKYTIQGVLHGSFNQCVTATGRLSSSKPNMQNQSKHDKSFKLREVFISRFPGGGLLEVDFGQLEFRIAALLSGCDKAIDAINRGVDIHSRTRDYYHGKLYMKPDELQPEMTRQQAKAECVPLNSLILTRTGWKSYHEVQVGEDVLAYNQHTGTNVWTPLLEKVFYKDTEVIRLSTKHNWGVTCTPDHRWYATKRVHKDGARVYEPCEVLASGIQTEHRITVAAPSEGGINTCSPEVAALLGWVYSDGSIRVSPKTGKTSQGEGGRRRAINACIIQKKFNSVIEDLLVSLNLLYTKKPHSTSPDCYVYKLQSPAMRGVFELSGLDPEHPFFVEWVCSLSTEAREAFLQAVFLAEGHTRGYGVQCISQNIGEFQEAIHLAAFMQGHDVRLTNRVGYTGNTCTRMTLRKKAYVTGQRLSKEILDERQDVWCPRTEYGSWVMKQGDTICITGNTFGPLYGKQTSYTDFFYAEYPGIKAWHERLMDEVIRTKESRIPSGRIFSFPDARRFQNAKGQILCSGHTQIKNYSVQGFATGDVVLLVLIYIHDRLAELGMESKLILDVHDSGVIDVHPDEFKGVVSICKEAFAALPAMIKDWFGIECTVPLDFDMAYGVNWYKTEKVV